MPGTAARVRVSEKQLAILQELSRSRTEAKWHGLFGGLFGVSSRTIWGQFILHGLFGKSYWGQFRKSYWGQFIFLSHRNIN